MNDLVSSSATIGLVISVIGYEIGTLLKRRFKLAIFNPLLVSIVLVIAVLLLFRIDFKSYNSSAKYLSYLLTPATVSLAIPLYEQLELLKKHKLAILGGVVAGVLTNLCTVLVLSLLFHLNHEEYVTILPKSITTAIGIGVSDELGGCVAITVAAILVTGVLGNVLAEIICKVFRITDPVAKGISIGTASHALGTAKAIEIGEIEGAMSSLSIVVAGICTLIGASVFANFL